MDALNKPSSVTRRELLAAPALLPAATPPNLILMLADDMGYADPSCFGNAAYETPHLDALARSGLMFRNFYSASAVCTPSRAAILTGRYPIRHDIRRHFPDDESHLPLTTTLPKLLRKSGYATAHVGKWHLGGLHQKHIRNRQASIPGPHQHGFDHYLCQNEEPPLRGNMGRDRVLFRKGGTCLIRNEENVTDSDPYFNRHYTDINGDESVRLIQQFHRQRRPFFLNLWFLAPHMPYEPAPEPFWSRAAAPGITDDQRRFRSMVMHMDHKIGQITAKLSDLGIRDHTLILFSSDNGGAYEANIGPFKGGKTDLHEGGIRVPGILSWPARIRRGRSEAVAHDCDILPTFCAAAGVASPKECDGLDLLRSRQERGPLFWQMDLYPKLQRHYPKPQPYATEAVRDGRWKLLLRDGVPQALFDLEDDARESTNLLGGRKEVAARLTSHARDILSEPRVRSGVLC